MFFSQNWWSISDTDDRCVCQVCHSSLGLHQCQPAGRAYKKEKTPHQSCMSYSHQMCRHSAYPRQNNVPIWITDMDRYLTRVRKMQYKLSLNAVVILLWLSVRSCKITFCVFLCATLWCHSMSDMCGSCVHYTEWQLFSALHWWGANKYGCNFGSSTLKQKVLGYININ